MAVARKRRKPQKPGRPRTVTGHARRVRTTRKRYGKNIYKLWGGKGGRSTGQNSPA